jgi:hypothetical protein
MNTRGLRKVGIGAVALVVLLGGLDVVGLYPAAAPAFAYFAPAVVGIVSAVAWGNAREHAAANAAATSPAPSERAP